MIVTCPRCHGEKIDPEGCGHGRGIKHFADCGTRRVCDLCNGNGTMQDLDLKSHK